jgi:hypothetical protein
MNEEKLKWAKKSYEEFCKYKYRGILGCLRKVLVKPDMDFGMKMIKIYEETSINAFKKDYKYYKELNTL